MINRVNNKPPKEFKAAEQDVHPRDAHRRGQASQAQGGEPAIRENDLPAVRGMRCMSDCARTSTHANFARAGGNFGNSKPRGGGEHGVGYKFHRRSKTAEPASPKPEEDSVSEVQYKTAGRRSPCAELAGDIGAKLSGTGSNKVLERGERIGVLRELTRESSGEKFLAGYIDIEPGETGRIEFVAFKTPGRPGQNDEAFLIHKSMSRRRRNHRSENEGYEWYPLRDSSSQGGGG
jgi:hypothetical protein